MSDTSRRNFIKRILQGGAVVTAAIILPNTSKDGWGDEETYDWPNEETMYVSGGTALPPSSIVGWFDPSDPPYRGGSIW